MNYIFDIGNVLVNYKPIEFLEELFSDSLVVDELYSTIFQSPQWLDMDRGLLSFCEATDIFCAQKPNLQTEIKKTMQNVNAIFTPINETIKLLPAIKEAGHGLYYLSNIQVEIRDYLISKHEFFKLFDGGVFSCDVKLIKPSPEIYQHLLKKYHLNAESCVFFDDMPENVTAAKKEGMKALLFTTAECVTILKSISGTDKCWM